MIVALTGYARSGKDTVGKILCEDHGFRRVAFGDTLKAIAEDIDPVLAMNIRGEDPVTLIPEVEVHHLPLSSVLSSCEGWEAAKDLVPESRQFLVDLGNSLRQRIPGVEVAAALGGVDPEENVVNTNVYHPEEIDEIRGLGGFVLRVLRPGHEPANADEARTGEHEVDATLGNDGDLDALRIKVAELVAYYSLDSREG